MVTRGQVLSHVTNSPGQTANDIAIYFDAHKNVITRILRSLEDAGLVSARMTYNGDVWGPTRKGGRAAEEQSDVRHKDIIE